MPGAGSWEPKGACRQVDSTYLAQQQLLADALCGAFANGTKCSSICSSAEQALCPGVSYLRYRHYSVLLHDTRLLSRRGFNSSWGSKD